MWTVTSGGLSAPPESPTTLNIKYSSVDVEGRIRNNIYKVEDLIPNCSVKQLEDIVYDLLGLSTRQPIELRYWGKPLDKERLLKDYAIKDNPIKDHAGIAEITVVVRPKLPAGVPVPGAELPLKRVRLASNKLQQPLAVEEGVTREMTVLELKQKVAATFQKQTVYLAADKCEADERTGTMALLKGDQLLLEQANVGGKKGVMRCNRPRDGCTGIVMETDVFELSLPVEEQQLFFEGLRMDDGHSLGHFELVHNERLFLEFRWPWDRNDEAEGGAAPKKEAGGKKKK